MQLFIKPLLALTLLFGLSACPVPTNTNATPNPTVLKCPDGFMANGECYPTSEAACSALGCATDQCLAALSKPPTMSCKTPTKCDSKQTIGDGKCYDTVEAACTAIGCSGDQCITTRSLPAIAACKPATPK
jgi:hypothetical protein